MITEEDLQIITLEEAKANCRIDTDEEDIVLLGKCKSAEQMVLNYLERTVSELRSPIDESIPQPIHDAVLMVTEDLFRHRGATTAAQQNESLYGVKSLLNHYRKL